MQLGFCPHRHFTLPRDNARFSLSLVTWYSRDERKMTFRLLNSMNSRRSTGTINLSYVTLSFLCTQL